MEIENIRCPYCKYLYDKIYHPNGGKMDYQKSVFSWNFPFLINNYFFDAFKINVNDNYIYIDQDMYEKKLHVTKIEDYSNGRFLKFCITHYINILYTILYEEINGSVSPALKKYYDDTEGVLNSINVKKIDLNRMFTLVFDILIIMNSITVFENNGNTGVADIVTGKPKFDSIVSRFIPNFASEKKYCIKDYEEYSNPYYIIDNNLNLKYKKLKLINFLPKNDFNMSLFAYNAASRDFYFLQVLRATYITANQAKIWKV